MLRLRNAMQLCGLMVVLMTLSGCTARARKRGGPKYDVAVINTCRYSVMIYIDDMLKTRGQLVDGGQELKRGWSDRKGMRAGDHSIYVFPRYEGEAEPFRRGFTVGGPGTVRLCG
jgi:hypothetical protein